MDLHKLSHRALADQIDKTHDKIDAVSGAIWDAAQSRDERWGEITARLGPNDARMIPYLAAHAALEAQYQEARSRCGPISLRSLYPTLLRSMGKRRAA